MVSKVLVWDAKHGTMLFDASSPEAWALSCLRVIELMDEMGLYEPWPVVEAEAIDIEALPEPYRSDAVKREAQIASDNAEAERNNQSIAALKKALAEHDVTLVTSGAEKHARTYPRVWALLERRSGHGYEYEGISVQEVWTAPK